MSENRQIVAILFADIVGYTSMMQKDELLASTLLKRFYVEIESKVNNHEGRIVNFYGDGALCIFQNPVEAVHAAMELQQSFQQSITIPVRIGLHSGSVVIEGDKVFGDSINIASRIESMGFPGAILLSKKIRDEIKNQAEFKFVSLGSFEFKNVDESLELFALSNKGFFIPKIHQMEGKLKSIQPKTDLYRSNKKWLILVAAGIVISFTIYLSNKKSTGQNSVSDGIKSIAVLPFRNLSNDSSTNYFADGMVEIIHNKLSEIKDLKIISMISTLSYRDHPKPLIEIGRELKVNNILEGSVLKDRDRIRIIVKLINATNDEQIWTEVFDKNLTDIFEIQSYIAQSITTALNAKLTNTELGKLSKMPTGNLEAYDVYLSALHDQRYTRFDSVLNTSAITKFKQSIQLDPNFDLAYAGLAFSFYERCKFGCGDPCRDSATRYLDFALRLNPMNAEALVLKGELASDHGDQLMAKKFYEQALEIAPNNNYAMNLLSFYYLAETDEVEKALNLYIESLARNPLNFDAENSSVQLYRQLGSLYQRADLFEEARSFEKKALAHASPGDRKAIYIMLGDMSILSGNSKDALAYYDSAEIKNSTSFNVLDIWAFGNDLAGNNMEAEATYNVMLGMIKNGFVEDINTHSFRHRYARLLWLRGEKEEAKKQFDLALKKLEGYLARGIQSDGQEYDIAGIYNFLGNKEKAFEWLEKMPFNETTYQLSRIDPLFKDMAGNPRYEKIIEKQREKVRKMQAVIKSYEVSGKLIKELKK